MMTPGGPGWNDPPSLSYETHTQTTSRRNMLTKRVPIPDLKFPDSPSPASLSDKCVSPPSGKKGLPPPPKMKSLEKQTQDVTPPQSVTPLKDNIAIFNPLQNSPESASGETQVPVDAQSPQSGITIFDPKESNKQEESVESKHLEDSMDQCDIESMEIIVVEELVKLAEKCQNEKIFTSQVKDNIIKKITVLEKQINDNKLPEPVIKKLELLTKYLVLKKYDNAWDAHLSLVCDHSSSVIQWIIGVKKLISEAKKLE